MSTPDLTPPDLPPPDLPPPDLPPVDFTNIGPQIGEPFPDVVLTDHTGRTCDLHDYRQGRQALVIFHRSADW